MQKMERKQMLNYVITYRDPAIFAAKIFLHKFCENQLINLSLIW